MSSVLIVGTTLAGAGIGAMLGCWYGFAVDKSDMPIYAAFTMPAGALVGGLVGVVAGSVIFA